MAEDYISDERVIQNPRRMKQSVNILERINRRLNDAEEWIIKLVDREKEITTAEQKKEKWMKRNEESLRDFWDIKHTDICIIRYKKEERERKDPRKYLKR